MNSENQEIHQRGDSDDEIAELRFQALLTKKENEAEVSPAHKPMPVDNSLGQAAINQPLSNFRGQAFNYRGRGGGSHYYNKPYLHTFSQQIASKSVNSNNIVVLTSSDPEDLKPSFGSEWAPPERGGYIPRGAGWPRGRGRGREAVHPSSNPSMPGNRQAPPLVLPQDKYAPQSQNSQEPDQNKHKLSARMRRLQGSDSDSEDSESDSSDDSSSTSSSDSNSSSSDSSSSDSDSDSDTGQLSPVKKTERVPKKVESGKHSLQTTTEHSGSSSHNHSTSKNLKSPIKSSLKVQPSESSKAFHSTFGKEVSRSPADRRPGSPKLSHSHSKSPSYSQKPKSPPPVRLRRSVSTSPKPRRRSRSPLRRSRTPIRRYGSRSPPRYRGSNSPRNPKSPLISKSPIGRYRSPPRSPYYETKRFRSRSPYLIKRALSPLLRRSSRSPLPPRRFSRSPVGGRLRSRSPKRYNSRSPRPVKRYGSLTPPPPGRPYRSKSPYSVRRYGSRSPRPYPKRISPGSPRRYRSKSPRNARSPFRKEILPKSPRLSRRSSFSPPTKRYGSRSPSTRGKEPLRGNRSPLFQPIGRTPVGGVSSPQRIKRIGSLSPKPLLDASNKFSRGQSPFRNFPQSPQVKRYGTPPLRRLSPDFKVAKHINEAIDPKDDVGLRNVPFARAVSPHRHNYANRSPSPYFRNRLPPPGIQAAERNFPAGSQSPAYYGGPGPLHMKMNRNIPYEKEVGPMGKRFPNEHPPPSPWATHKSEIGLPPPKEPLLHHYPPKFMDTEYNNRPGYLPQHPPPQIIEKPWPPGPPNRGLSNFGNGRGHQRLERLADGNMPQHMVMERGRGRGRGGRGMRGQRGAFRGVHTRLGRGGAWNQHQTQPPLYDLPPPFEDPYLREKPLRIGIPPPLMETDMAYFERKPPQPFDGVKPPLLPLIHPQKGLSPGRLQRIPRGPKTPPYSPNREPSPIEWEKRARGKPRTPSRSPSPHRYGSEIPKSISSHFKPREHIDIADSRSHGESIGSHKPLYRSRSPYTKDEQTYGGAHGHRIDSRKESNMREMDDRKKISHSRSEDHNYKGKDIRRAYSNEDLSLNSNEKLRERDRRIDERHRSPLPPRAKGTESYGTRNKDYEDDFKKERDVRGRREAVEQKGRREHEDQRGRRETEEHSRRRDDEQRIKKDIEDDRVRRESEDQKGRREIENQRSRRESGDQRGRKDHNEMKSRKEAEEHHKSRKPEIERKERREIEDNRGARDSYELSDKRHISLEDNLKLKVKKEDQKNERDERKKDNRGDEGIRKEKDNLRYDRKDDKDFDKTSNKSYDKHSDLRHRDEKRESKDTQEHMKKKEIKESKEKLPIKAGLEEKKKKKKKHKEDDRLISKSSKKKKKEKKKKKDSKKHKKKSKEFDEEEEDFTKKKNISSSRSLSKHDGDMRHIMEPREDSSRGEKGSLKRKDASSSFDTDDRENGKRRKESFVPSSAAKDDWKWKGNGRDVERRKEEREPPPLMPKERSRGFSSSDKRSSDSSRGGKGFFVTVNSSHDRHVSSNKDIVKKESTSRLPVHMRLGGKSKVEETPLKATTGAMKGGKKGQRMGENIGSLGRRKVVGGGGTGRSQQQHSQRRQGMKGGMGAAKRTNR